MIPLQRTILYSADSYPNEYWSEQRNTTEWNIFMTEMVSASNALSKALLKILAPTLPGAHVGRDTYAYPEADSANSGITLRTL